MRGALLFLLPLAIAAAAPPRAAARAAAAAAAGLEPLRAAARAAAAAARARVLASSPAPIDTPFGPLAGVTDGRVSQWLGVP